MHCFVGPSVPSEPDGHASSLSLCVGVGMGVLLAWERVQIGL